MLLTRSPTRMKASFGRWLERLSRLLSRWGTGYSDRAARGRCGLPRADSWPAEARNYCREQGGSRGCHQQDIKDSPSVCWGCLCNPEHQAASSTCNRRLGRIEVWNRLRSGCWLRLGTISGRLALGESRLGFVVASVQAPCGVGGVNAFAFHQLHRQGRSRFGACQLSTRIIFRRSRGRLPLRSDQPPVQPSVALLAARQEVRPGQGQIRPMADGLNVMDISRSPSAALATDGLSSQDGVA
jgi:hypothetical protein